MSTNKSIFKILIPSIVGGFIGVATLDLLFDDYSMMKTFLVFAILSGIVNCLVILNRKKN